MKLHRSGRRGFSLVELLAVVLVLAVLAAVAIPLYLNTRRTSAARACKANLAAIVSAQSAYCLRNGEYATEAQLLTAPEGLQATPACPLDRTAYNWSVPDPLPTSALTITCTNGVGAASLHRVVMINANQALDWTKVLPVPTTDNSTDP